MPEDDRTRVILEEYRTLWAYYTTQINVLGGFRDLYIKIFVVPSTVLVAIASIYAKIGEPQPSAPLITIAAEALALAMLVAFSMGMSLFVSYYKELGNLGNYERAMIAIRDELRRAHSLQGTLVIDYLRRSAPIAELARTSPRAAFFRSLLFSLGSIFVIGNSLFLGLTLTFTKALIPYSLCSAWLETTGIITATLVWTAVLIYWSYRLYIFYGSGAAELSSGDKDVDGHQRHET